MASPDLDNIYSAACKITLDGAELGHTQEGIRYQAGHIFRDRNVDKYGDTPADIIHVGDFMRVMCRVTEETYGNLTTVYPLAAVAGTSTAYLGETPGTKGSTVTKLLVLESLIAADSFKLVIHKAVAKEAPAETEASPGGDRVWDVTFEALIDETQDDGKLLGYVTVNT